MKLKFDRQIAEYHLYIHMTDPIKQVDLNRLHYEDKQAQDKIKSLQGYINLLQQYRLDMAERAAYLIREKPIHRAELIRKKNYYSNKVFYYLNLYSCYPDGSERMETICTYPGTERAKAIREFKEYQRTHSGTECKMDIQRSKWER